MDTGLALRPTGVAAPTTTVRPDAAPVRDAVPTDLAPAQTVAAGAKSSPARGDAAPGPSDPSLVHKIILDAHSREVIYQVVASGSGQVVRQIPEEATLRLRAYMRAELEKRDRENAVEKTA